MFKHQEKKINTWVKSLVTVSALSAGLLTSVPASLANTITPEINQYIQSVSKQYQFDPKELTKLFKHAHMNPDIIARMNHPYEAKPWAHYREFFITPARIEQGVTFWEANRDVLTEAEQRFGVPASVIVAILGVETFYGQYTGKFSVFDALTTLSFNHQPRAEFFKSELTQYLLMTREQKLDPLALTGSYAGALGMPQFMPSSYRRYAIDYTEGGSADLIHDSRDAIFSIANFLKNMGWQVNKPVAFNIKTHRPLAEQWLSMNAKPMLTLKTLQSRGIARELTLDKNTPVAIIKLEAEKAFNPNYWITTNNFRAIMHYNPKINYAMAVYQLSEEIQNAYKQTITARAKSTSTRSAQRSTV
jgi:membrane-bound lytic murein transglycosylase B